MIDLYDGHIQQLLSIPWSNDPRVRAISYALLAEKQRIIDSVRRTRTHALIDELPEDVLDELAVELRVPVYQENFSIETKRAAIKEWRRVYRLLGTKAGVVRLLSTIYKKCTVLEWFEYNADPYHFKLSIDITDDTINPLSHEKILHYIDFTKPVRAELDDVGYYILLDGRDTLNLYAGIGQQAANTLVIDCEEPTLETWIFLSDENGDQLADEDGAWLVESDDVQA